jgi:hypothetical protein
MKCNNPSLFFSLFAIFSPAVFAIEIAPMLYDLQNILTDIVTFFSSDVILTSRIALFITIFTILYWFLPKAFSSLEAHAQKRVSMVLGLVVATMSSLVLSEALLMSIVGYILLLGIVCLVGLAYSSGLRNFMRGSGSITGANGQETQVGPVHPFVHIIRMVLLILATGLISAYVKNTKFNASSLASGSVSQSFANVVGFLQILFMLLIIYELIQIFVSAAKRVSFNRSTDPYLKQVAETAKTRAEADFAKQSEVSAEIGKLTAHTLRDQADLNEMVSSAKTLVTGVLTEVVNKDEQTFKKFLENTSLFKKSTFTKDIQKFILSISTKLHQAYVTDVETFSRTVLSKLFPGHTLNQPVDQLIGSFVDKTQTFTFSRPVGGNDVLVIKLNSNLNKSYLISAGAVNTPAQTGGTPTTTYTELTTAITNLQTAHKNLLDARVSYVGRFEREMTADINSMKELERRVTGGLFNSTNHAQYSAALHSVNGILESISATLAENTSVIRKYYDAFKNYETAYLALDAKLRVAVGQYVHNWEINKDLARNLVKIATRVNTLLSNVGGGVTFDNSQITFIQNHCANSSKKAELLDKLNIQITKFGIIDGGGDYTVVKDSPDYKEFKERITSLNNCIQNS